MPWCMQSTYSIGEIKDGQILGIPPMKRWSINLLPLLLGWPWWLAPSITRGRNDKLGSKRLGHKKLLPEAPGTLALETVSPQVTSLPPLRLQTPEKPTLTAWRGHVERGTGLAPAGPPPQRRHQTGERHTLQVAPAPATTGLYEQGNPGKSYPLSPVKPQNWEKKYLVLSSYSVWGGLLPSNG